MSKALRRRKGSVLDATLLAIAGVAILIGLGVWQLDRKVWKENLITTINARLARAPENLPPRASWLALREDGAEFRRVVFPAEFLDGEEALVYTAGFPLRPDVKGPGIGLRACPTRGRQHHSRQSRFRAGRPQRSWHARRR